MNKLKKVILILISAVQIALTIYYSIGFPIYLLVSSIGIFVVVFKRAVVLQVRLKELKDMIVDRGKGDFLFEAKYGSFDNYRIIKDLDFDDPEWNEYRAGFQNHFELTCWYFFSFLSMFLVYLYSLIVGW